MHLRTKHLHGMFVQRYTQRMKYKSRLCSEWGKGVESPYISPNISLVDLQLLKASELGKSLTPLRIYNANTMYMYKMMYRMLIQLPSYISYENVMSPEDYEKVSN